MSVETMYDEKPPSHNYIRNALIIAFLVGLVCLFLAPLLSCNTAKHDQKQLDKIAVRHKDLLDAELHKLFPETKDTIKVGKPQTKIIRVVDSSAAHNLRNQLSRLQNLVKNCAGIDSQYIQRLIDSTRQSALEDCNPIQETDSIVRIDTIYRTSSETQAYIQTFSDSLSKYKEDKIKAITERDIYKSERNSARLYFSILLFLVITGGIIAAVRMYYKSKLPT